MWLDCIAVRAGTGNAARMALDSRPVRVIEWSARRDPRLGSGRSGGME